MRIDRRACLGALAAAFICPLAKAQQQRIDGRRIGFLSGRAAEDDVTKEFRRGLQELGYREGRDLTVEYRWAGGNAERFRKLAAELVHSNVEVIVVSSTTGALAARSATATIPIVFIAVGDPVGAGVVSNLARPEGNVTGLTHVSVDLAAKTVALLKEAVPQILRVAVLAPFENPTTALKLSGSQTAARSLQLKLQVLDVRSAQDLDRAFVELDKERPQGLLTLLDGLTLAHRKRIADFALKHRLPSIYETRDFVEAGGLISYGADFARMYRRAAGYVDRILKGTKPAELPVEQAGSFELVINLKTAKALGIVLPQSLLLRASEIIQ
jgi:putative ABC transport system substrate-binding protein